MFRAYAAARSDHLIALGVDSVSSDAGGARFLYDDLGGLTTDDLERYATPWKLVAAALVLDRRHGTGRPVDARALPEILAEFGFVAAEEVGNWSGPPPYGAPGRPVGILAGRAERAFPPFRLEIANLGCASCHAGVTYDADGQPQREVWLGLPNTSLDLDAFVRAVFGALERAVEDPSRLLQAVRTLHPGVDEVELMTLERYVLPRVARRLRQLREAWGGPVPFDNGGPGVTNGAASLRTVLGLPVEDGHPAGRSFVSIPDLGATWLRSSLLADGAYAVSGRERFRPVRAEEGAGRELAAIVAIFTVPAFGLEPHRARTTVPRVEEILAFLRGYEPPAFPGPVDRELARSGRDVYRAACAACHGRYAGEIGDPVLVEFPNRLVPVDSIATDPERSRAIDPEVIAAVRASVFGGLVEPAATGGYVAPDLSGLWATAPYLHNGSVPTLWHLMHPEARPARFLVGGHRLDFRTVGIAGEDRPDGLRGYPPGYEPWSVPRVYDTSEPGRSRRGHERQFEALTEAEKEALLEFLKLL